MTPYTELLLSATADGHRTVIDLANLTPVDVGQVIVELLGEVRTLRREATARIDRLTVLEAAWSLKAISTPVRDADGRLLGALKEERIVNEPD